VIRVNSQSGKGGVAWVLEQDKGLKLPKRMQADFSRHVQRVADETSRELNAADIWGAFEAAYLPSSGDRFELVDYSESHGAAGQARTFVGQLRLDGETRSISGKGNGLLSSLLSALRDDCGIDLDVVDYSEHAIGNGSDAQAAAYLECTLPDGTRVFGAGIDADVATATVRAALSAANRVAA
jgi:2-isopropylmalate synthase